MKRSLKRTSLNLAFVAMCSAILLFLLRAPEETTPPLPFDEAHRPLFDIADKKEAESHCDSCHGPAKLAPLPADHPPKYRCLFCHKREK